MPFYDPDNRGGVRGIGGTILPRALSPNDRAGPLGVGPNPMQGTPQAPNQAPSPFVSASVPPPAYVSPMAYENQLRGNPAALAAGQMSFANRRLAALRRLAATNPEIMALLGQGQGLDPAAAWRTISGGFANYAREQGIPDPRTLLMPGYSRREFG